MTGRGTGKKWTDRAASKSSSKQRAQAEAVEGMQGFVLPVFGGVTMEGVQEKMEAEAKKQRGQSIREYVAIEVMTRIISNEKMDFNVKDAAEFCVKAGDALAVALGYSLPQEEPKEKK